jgi:hypothetical protein
MTANQSPATGKPPLLSPRSALILLLAICSGLVVGALTKMAGKSVAEAVLAGLVATGTSAIGFNSVIGP